MQEKAKRFPTGRLLCTPNAMNQGSREERRGACGRQQRGGGGEVAPEDWRSNNQALRQGRRILSAYRTRTGQKFGIITEADRSATTILLPEDY